MASRSSATQLLPPPAALHLSRPGLASCLRARQVWHRRWFRSDVRLGSAHVPLWELLQRPSTAAAGGGLARGGGARLAVPAAGCLEGWLPLRWPTGQRVPGEVHLKLTFLPYLP